MWHICYFDDIVESANVSKNPHFFFLKKNYKKQMSNWKRPLEFTMENTLV